MVVSTTLILVVLAKSDRIPEFIVNMFSSAGFARAHGQSGYINHSRRASINVGYSKVEAQVNLERIYDERDRVSVRSIPRPRILPSGMWIGRNSRWSPGETHSELLACSEGAHVSFIMSCALNRTSAGIAKATSPITNEDEKLAETVARWLLAARSGKSYASNPTQLSGVSYVGKKSLVSNRVHIDAKTWSQRNGYTFRVNVDSACAIITRPSGDILLPLGSPKVKVGPQWRDIGDIVIADGENVMIPVEIINQL